MSQSSTGVFSEVLKIVGSVAAVAVAGWLAIDKVTHEARMTADREARVEMMRKFVANPDDLNDVFRALALLVRTGLLADNDSRLTKEIERFFGQEIGEISLSNITVADTLARTTLQTSPSTTALAVRPSPLPSAPPPSQPASAIGPVAAEPRPTSAVGPTPGDLLAARVELLNDATPSTRTRTAQQIIAAIRDDEMGPEDQLKVVGALVGLARNERMRGLSATGRYNLLYVLSEVPQTRWRMESWRAVTEDLRASLATLDARIRSNAVRVGDDTRRVLDTLNSRLS